MAETALNLRLIGRTQLDLIFISEVMTDENVELDYSDAEAIALTAIRTCYSPNRPSDIIGLEGQRYFGTAATDGGAGSDAERLFRHIVASGHTSTMEHVSFTFAIEGVSRALLAQLTRHRVGFSFSVQSQRYVKFSTGSKSGGFDYVIPEKVKNNQRQIDVPGEGAKSVAEYFESVMQFLQEAYDCLQAHGVPQEDARAILPQASACNLVMTANLRSLFTFYGKRRQGRGAQYEITQLAEAIRGAVVAAEPWTDPFFEQA